MVGSEIEKKEEQSFPNNNNMSFVEHLGELRIRLFRCIFAVLLVTCITYYYSDSITAYLEKPLLTVLPKDQQYLYFTGIADKFFTYFQISIVSALVLVSPYLLSEIWMFVVPGLYRHEKRLFLPFLFFGSLSFFVGILFAFYAVLPIGYKFLIEFGSANERPIITITEYFNITLKLLFGMGLIFEIPIMMAILAYFGLIDPVFLKKYRKHAFLLATVISALLTPTPDAITMLLVMIPLYLLYEVGIVCAKYIARLRDKGRVTE